MKITVAITPEDFVTAKILFEAYAGTLNFDLSYQDFESELNYLEQQYSSPAGALLLCYIADEFAVGCAGIRYFSAGIAELKRLYVRSEYRNLKIGKSLLEKAIETARQLGYQSIRLDTVPGQEKAHELYRHLGFVEIESYRYSPIRGTIYFEKILFLSVCISPTYV